MTSCTWGELKSYIVAVNCEVVLSLTLESSLTVACHLLKFSSIMSNL